MPWPVVSVLVPSTRACAVEATVLSASAADSAADPLPPPDAATDTPTPVEIARAVGVVTARTVTVVPAVTFDPLMLRRGDVVDVVRPKAFDERDRDREAGRRATPRSTPPW